MFKSCVGEVKKTTQSFVLLRSDGFKIMAILIDLTLCIQKMFLVNLTVYFYDQLLPVIFSPK